MADTVAPPTIEFDTARARADGIPDAAIAEYLASKVGFNLAAARADKVPDSAIVDFLAPAKPKAEAAPTPAPQPEAKPSGLINSIGKALGQALPEAEGRLVGGFGRMVESAGTAIEASPIARQQIDIMDKIDGGAGLGDFRSMGDLDRLFARQYQIADADQRKQLRQEAINTIADPTAANIAGSAKRVGSTIAEAGKKIEESGEQQFPMTDEEKNRFSVRTTKILGGLATYIGAAAVGGMPAMVSMAGVDSFGTTFDEAKAKGASDEVAAKAALINGTVQGASNLIPMHQAMVAMDAIPRAFRGEFIKAATEMAKSSGALLTFSQFAHLAENIVAKNTYDPERPLTQGLGEHLGETALAAAILPAAGAAARAALGATARRVRTPEETGAKVMESPGVDEAIAKAREVVDQPREVIGPPTFEEHVARPQEQDQAALNRLFGGLNEGQVERAQDGAWHYRDENDKTFPLQPWDGREREDTIPAGLAAAQRQHYEQAGVKVVYFEDVPVNFDGAAADNTIFLSNKPQRNAAQLGAHEFTHVLESTRLPDGTNLADILHQQVAAGITAEGRAYAERLFGPDAPKREKFEDGAQGDAAHATAVSSHVIRELSADIGGEALKFPSFIPRVLEAVEARFGQTVLRDVLGKLMAGIERAMTTLRQFFFRPEDAAQYGPPATESQKWVSNLAEIHGTLARAYAEQLGRPAELAAPRAQARLEAPALVTPPPRPPITPDNVFKPETYGRRLSDLVPEPARVDRPHVQPMGMAAERERLEGKSNAEGGMGRRDMTLGRNQRMADAWARWNVMHEEVGDANIRRIVDDSGASPDHLDQISRYYIRKQGETPRQAFENAVSRWIDKAEADAIREYNLIDSELEAPRGEKPASQPSAEDRVEAARPGEPGGGEGGREAGDGREPARGSAEPPAEPAGAGEAADRGPARVEQGPATNAREAAALKAAREEVARLNSAANAAADAGNTTERDRLFDQADEAKARVTEAARALADADAKARSPARVEQVARQVEEARETTNTDPTEGQKEAGNYQKGRVSFHGLPFVMENPEGSMRRGKDANGKEWEAKLPADYGYISRTLGADGDHVDAYIGKHHDSQRVWVVDQIDPKTGKFDEHKVMLGMRSVTEARATYHRAFSDGTGPKRIGAITEMSLDQFKVWLESGDTKSPAGKLKAETPVQQERAKLDEMKRPEAAEREKAEPTRRLETESETSQPDHQLADRIARHLEQESAPGVLKLSAAEAQRFAEQHYGGTLAEGKYSRDRLYDAVELGVNRYIQKHPERFDPTVNAEAAKRVAEDLAGLKEKLLTQTVRAGEKDAYQQFSTPPDYAYAANWIANLKPTDHVLEPSAGVGGLLVHAMNGKVAETTGNEISAKRRGMLEALRPTRVTGEDAAQLHNILPDDVRPTVVVMNPPFSRAAERMGGKMVLDEGAKHIEQALARLEPGGRLVAIVGDGMKPAGTVTEGYSRDRGRGGGGAFRDWWAKIGAEYDVRANVGVDRDIYSKYGTAFPTRLLVIDKIPPSGRPMVTGQARDAADLIDRLQEVRNDRGNIEQRAHESGRAEVADRGERAGGPQRELFGAARDVGAGEGRGERAASAVAEPTGASRGRGDAGEAARGEPAAGEPVVRAEPQSRAGRAGDETAALSAERAEPAGSGEPSGRDGIRPDGSGERERPGVTEAPEEVLATENAVAKPDNRELSEAVYEAYKPQRARVVGAKEHPGALVQSAAMASVLPPKTDYKPKIPQVLVKDGALSDAQLEAITYAGHAQSDVMPNGKRRGFFIGDGTGVGKGREIAGILLDNKQQGRRKAVWVSEKRQLVNDAQRDWNGLGQPKTEIIDHGKIKGAHDIPGKQNGILFTTYDTLKSAEKIEMQGGIKGKGRSRVDQIVEWLGKDFDGVIAFDEAHNLGNAVDEKGSRGVKKAAQKALAGIELQDRLPNARVVYVSATGATEVGNLAYADRLGLWGEGTPFPTRADFVGKVSEGGMAAMELVARDMKALGHYIARSLSYDGVTYERVEHKLSADQRQTYDKMAEGWQTVLQNIHKALELTGGTEDGKSTGRQKSAAMSAFWGAHQRFFNQIITSMQMPSVLRAVEKDVKEGRQAVLQLVNTMEAAQERALEKAKDRGEDLENLDMTPRDQLMQMIEKSFPVQQMEKYVDDNGNERTRGVVDSKGEPVLNKQAVAMRERMLDEVGSLRVPDGPLEILLNHFGSDKVAEVTGRGQRVVRKVDDESGQMKSVVEKRGSQVNVAESNDFQAGKKPILIFSEAGGTGRSYHAAIGSGSEGARRAHYLVQGGWRADKAVQGFGRTHRTSQASAPIFNLVTTDLQGQKRFISSIARRLGQLGALTKGERRTGDQGMFGARDNLESTEARDALRQFYHDVARGNVEGVDMRTLEDGMGLKMRDPETGGLAKDLPEMSQFLNRVLSLKIDDQNRVFEAFSERLDNVIARAAAAGTLDTGVETYKADKIGKVSEQVVYTDPRSGAETRHVHLNVQNRNHPVSFEDTLAGRNKTNGKKPDSFIQNEQSGNVFAVTEAGSKTLENGGVVEQVRLTSPLDYQFVERNKIQGDNWKRLTADQARPLWDEKVASTPEFRNSDLHIITGAVLPIWDRLGGSPKIYRLQTADGERMLGRVVPASRVDETLNRLGAEGLKIDAKPAEVAQRILKGATAELANGWTIKASRVAGENRLELKGPNYTHAEELKRHGIFSERISYETRYFIPTGEKAAAAIEGITKNRPVASLTDREGPAFSPRPSLTPAVKVGERVLREEDHLKALYRMPANTPEEIATRQQAILDGGIKGFIDDRGRFLDREKAHAYAIANDLLKEDAPSWARTHPELISENLRNDAKGPIFSPRIKGENPDRKYTPEQKAAFERVGRATESTTLRDKIDEARDDIGRKLARETLDAFAGLKRDDPEGYMAARLANSVAGAQEVFRLHGTLKFDGSTYNYKDLNGGVRGLVKSLGPEAHDFLWWVAANRAERLKAEDRENLFSAEDISTLKQLNRGELGADYEMPNGTKTRKREAAYMDALRQYDALNKSVLDLVRESGLVKGDVIDQLWSDPFYVPFFREAEDQGSTRFIPPTSGFVKQYATKKLKGGSDKLRNDLWDNALGNWDHMIDAALRNRAAAQILDTSSRLGAAEKIKAADAEYRLSRAEKAETTWVMRDGEKEFYRVSDPMVFKAVTALEGAGPRGPVMKVARWFSRALRYGVTSNPMFAVRNLIRDTENSIAVANVSANPFKNLADGFSQIDTGERLKNIARAVAGRDLEHAGMEPEAISAMAGGALMRLGTGSDAGVAKTAILDTPGKLGAFKRYVTDVAGAYKEALGAAEDVNRLALYKQQREQGAPHDFASFSARDLQDFTLHGASPFVRAITDITPFLNARMQGLYKLGRVAADSDRNVAAAVGGKVARSLAMRAATVMGAMTVAGLALDAIYRDDEDYKKRTEFDRSTYFWFKIGDAQFRIPKGFEIAALSSMAADGIEAFFDKEMTGKRWVNNFWTQMGTNLQLQAPAAIQPVIDVATNTRGTGGPIESTGMERLEPQERYGPDTTLIARGASSAINAALRTVAPRAEGPSPVQIDYLTNAYGAWLATSVLGMADMAVRAASNEPEKPAKDFWAQATQGMVRTDPAPQSRYVNMLYEQGKAIEEAHSTFLNLAKMGRTEEARAFVQDRKDELLKYPAFQRVKKLEGEINQQVRIITNDSKLSGEQKKIRIMQLQSLKNKAAQQLFEASP